MNPETCKHCHSCGIDYEERECPSCNPKVQYYVEIGVDMGKEDFQFSPCKCEECQELPSFWNLHDAKSHARAMGKAGVVMRVVDEEGTELWATA